MKVLKPLKSGLIVHEKFDSDSVHPPLKVNASYVVNQSGWNILDGYVYMLVENANTIVFVAENSFIPASDKDLAGIKLSRGRDKKELYEYYDPNDSTGGIRYVKVVKNGDVFYGYGSNDEVNWIDRGYVNFSSVETIGVNVDSDTPYELNSIKVYTSEYVTLTSLMPGWRVVVKSGVVTHVNAITDSSTMKVKLPRYPYTGTVTIYDTDDTKVAESSLVDIWGGDEYICALDVEIYNSQGESITLDTVQQLGNLTGTEILEQFTIKNIYEEPLLPTIRVANYSPFGDWVTLSVDSNGSTVEFVNEIAVPLDGLGEAKFWIRITRPPNPVAHDYRNTDCLFYLEVV